MRVNHPERGTFRAIAPSKWIANNEGALPEKATRHRPSSIRDESETPAVVGSAAILAATHPPARRVVRDEDIIEARIFLETGNI
jgi:hypothetical protein